MFKDHISKIFSNDILSMAIYFYTPTLVTLIIPPPPSIFPKFPTTTKNSEFPKFSLKLMGFLVSPEIQVNGQHYSSDKLKIKLTSFTKQYISLIFQMKEINSLKMLVPINSTYRKPLKISPGLILVQMPFLGGLFSGEELC